MAKKKPWLTPYHYCSNNPIKYIDPTGMDWYRSKDGTAYMWREGNEATHTQTYTGENGEDFTIEYERHGESFSETINGTNILWKQNEVVATWDMPSFSQKELSGMEKWNNSDNFALKVGYNIANDFYLVSQIFSFDLIGENRVNELTGSAARVNLDGTTNYNQEGAIVNVIGASFGTMAQRGATEIGVTIPKGLLHIENIEKAGFLGGIVNWGIKAFNSFTSRGNIVKQAKALKKKDEQQ